DLEVARKIRIPMGEGIAGQVARDKKPLLITGKAPIREIRRLHGRNDVKSALSVPLTIGEECIGVINISSSESAHAFTEEDLHFLVSLINLSAEVIYRSDEMEKIEGADRKFSLWKEVNSIMASLGPLDARLNNVCSAISDYIYGVTSSIYLYNREDAALVMKASSVKSVARVGGITLHRGEGIEGRVWKTKKSVVLVEREVEPGRHTLYLAIPMMTYGEFIGVLSVHLVLHEEPAQYIEPLLTDLATLLADNIAISNRHEESMLQSTRIVAADATGLELLSITDPDSFYDTVAATLAAIIGAEGATIRTRSHGSGKFSLRGSFGLDDFIIREYYLPIEREVLIEALASEDIVRKEIVSGESDYIHSVLAHPLTDDNKVIGGAVTLFNKSADGAIYARNFSRADMEVLKRFVPYIQQGIKMMAPCDARAREYEFITTREFFERRAAEEISRGSRLGSHFLLLALRMPGLATLSRYEGKEAVQGILSSVRARIGNFAIVAKLDEESLAILFLESDKKALRGIENILNFPGSESIFTTMNPVGGSEVCYGYARFPEDGATITKILNRAFERSHTPVVRDEGKLV
ncbi:MAG: GAF domain-containing protein, partial [Thermodesulfobacteriota bacterium]